MYLNLNFISKKKRRRQGLIIDRFSFFFGGGHFRHHTPSGTRDVVILLDYIDLTAAIACIAIGFGLLLASRREYPNKE